MILAIGGQKGGIGKTTLSVFIASELHARGRRVMLIDADPRRYALGWYSAAREAKHPVPDFLAEASRTLHEQIPALAGRYDDVIVDTPAALDGEDGSIQRSALMAAHLALLPCAPTHQDVLSVAGSLATLREAMEYRPQLRAAIVVNRKRPGTRSGAQARGGLEKTGIPLLHTEIGEREDFSHAFGAGQGLRAYRPRGKAAIEIGRLVSELLKMETTASSTKGAKRSNGSTKRAAGSA